MKYVTLGRTGLHVSKVGLGCGGHARLGTLRGGSENNAVAIVRRALDRGINFIDTATAYHTEPFVGRAIKGLDRSKLVISSKFSSVLRQVQRPSTAEEFAQGIDDSLTRLDTDYIDLYFVHGLQRRDYDHCVNHFLPVLDRAKKAGKIRFICVSEGWELDHRHEMLRHALPGDDLFDVVMVGYNLLNQSARHTVFPLTMKNNVGTLLMFAVREALSKPDKLNALLTEQIEAGNLSRDAIDPAHALDFLTAPGVARSIPEAAYRFCAHEPGVDVVLTGTGSLAHLDENIDSILAGPLPPDVTARLRTLFGHLDDVTGN